MDHKELDRVDRALAAQLSSSSGLNLRASLLAGFAAMAILFLADFSTSWLDDARWEIGDVTDTVLQVSLVVAVAALGGCMACALVAAWPRREWSDKQAARIQALVQRDHAQESRLVREAFDDLWRVNRMKAATLTPCQLTAEPSAERVSGHSLLAGIRVSGRKPRHGAE